jgi:hypothetical protein
MNRHSPLILSLAGLIFFCQIVSAQQIEKIFILPSSRATVNLKQQADMEAMYPKPAGVYTNFIPNKGIKPAEQNHPVSPFIPGSQHSKQINVASPNPTVNYEAAPDEAMGGGTSGTYTIPPDTYGAVGLDKVFTTLNNNYRIHNKSTGASLSLVSAQVFWNSLGADASGVFDPRVIYDPYNNRWIIVAVSNGGSSSSRIIVGISENHNPQGNFTLYAFNPVTGSGQPKWADFPMVGFNKNWIAISVNLFTVSSNMYVEGRMLVIDYPAIRSGTATSTLFTGIAAADGGFCMHPATTCSSTENTLYLVSHISSAGATYKLSSITGTPATPVLNIGTTQTRPGGGWAQAGGNTLPQQCLSSCPGTLVFADPGDQFNRGNVVFRNGYVWHTQTIQSSAAPVHTMVQWTKLDAASGVFSDGGRIEDVTATSSNGGRWYGHPSVAVNSGNHALVGFAKGESDGFIGGGYAMRLSGDLAGTMQDPVIYKDGEDYYHKDFGGGRNRWGDYSHTVVDPLNDATFWTIQEYAKPRAAPSIGGSTSKWGTWWAKVDPEGCLSGVVSGNWNTVATWGCGGVPTSNMHVNILSGHNVTLDVDPLAASITVMEGGTLTVNSNRNLSCKLIVYGTVNITGGKLSLGNNDIFLGGNAVVTGASSTSYFITNGTGRVSKIIPGGGSFIFPLSPNSSSYNPLTIALNGGDPEEMFSVRVEPGINPTTGTALNDNNCVQRTWQISELTPGSNNATLTFQWSPAEHGSGFSVASAPYAFRHNGVTYVLAQNLTLPASSGGFYTSSTAGTVNSFSPWIINKASTLPVNLNYFTGIKLADDHQLNWKVSCSGANATFELQRSASNKNFTAIANIQADYARCLQPFSFLDHTPLTGRNFYRLKIIDESGKINYSSVVLLLNSKSGIEILSLQPNPVNSAAVLNLSVASRETVELGISDQKGSIVMQKQYTLNAGSHQLALNLSSLAPGGYVLRLVSSGSVVKTLQFIKQ